MAGLKPTELLLIVAILLVLFGSTQIPKLARSLGQAQREFREGLDEGASETDSEET